MPYKRQPIKQALHYRDGREYQLEAFSIMPNHVHFVCRPLQKKDRSYPSLKRFTARQANLVLEREGQFWQHENYDHVVRDEGELSRIINYVIENPVKAKLVEHWKDWEWSYCRYDL